MRAWRQGIGLISDVHGAFQAVLGVIAVLSGGSMIAGLLSATALPQKSLPPEFSPGR
jgi:hypothetical protein